jgi:hypothetical protein
VRNPAAFAGHPSLFALALLIQMKLAQVPPDRSSPGVRLDATQRRATPERESAPAHAICKFLLAHCARSGDDKNLVIEHHSWKINIASQPGNLSGVYQSRS